MTSERPDATELTRLLREIADGDSSAADDLLPLVYGELRALAGALLRDQRGGHTLQPTALVHEAYLRIAGAPSAIESRRHFMNVAAMAMRQLLADHARRKRAEKRGGGWRRVTLSSAPDDEGVDLVALDDALARLEALDARQARVVELRFLAGMTVPEAAQVLDVSPRTVDADWRLARAWLQRELASK